MAATQHLSKLRTRTPTTSREEPHEQALILSELAAEA